MRWGLSLLLTSAQALIVLGGPSSISLLGSAQDGSEASLSFATFDDRARTSAIVATAGGLEVRKDNFALAVFNPQVTSISKAAVSGILNVASLNVGKVRQWALFHFDTFDVPREHEQWSDNARSNCNVAGDSFLGGHCKFAGTNTTKRFSNLSPHNKVKVRARVHFFDDWEGESVLLQVNGKTAWSQSHKWCPGLLKWKCKKFGIDSCGRNTPDRLSVRAVATMEHSGTDLHISFASNLPKGSDACRVSWGVDDVSIEVL
eukprot:TRINITY_DN20821_c0_g1_i1.p1 TRINITY_DN20821_c0_g1~~TRINITY_DN20821_c0_g1_i1.p1  ORF type:complete len:260 (-),score=28.14 TRINITY_DN20821_c0_g1_i1:524-1303(-)